jgi:hypothetical protein
MYCRCFLYGPLFLGLSLGGLLTGCGKKEGQSPDSQVQGLQLSSELERTKKELAAAEKNSAAKDDALVLAKEETEKVRKEAAEREAMIIAREKKVHAIEAELAEMKKRDAFFYVEASRLHKDNLNTSALDRYKQFIAAFPSSPLVADANRAIAELGVTAPKEARARAVAVDPYAVERETLKKFNEGWATPEDLAPLLRRKSRAEVIKLLGPPNTTYREGTELGYVDKVVDSTNGGRGTLVVGFEEDRVATLRVGYLGRAIRP